MTHLVSYLLFYGLQLMSVWLVFGQWWELDRGAFTGPYFTKCRYYTYCALHYHFIKEITVHFKVTGNLPTNQLAVSQVADCSTRGLLRLPKLLI